RSGIDTECDIMYTIHKSTEPIVDRLCCRDGVLRQVRIRMGRLTNESFANGDGRPLSTSGPLVATRTLSRDCEGDRQRSDDGHDANDGIGLNGAKCRHRCKAMIIRGLRKRMTVMTRMTAFLDLKRPGDASDGSDGIWSRCRKCRHSRKPMTLRT